MIFAVLGIDFLMQKKTIDQNPFLEGSWAVLGSSWKDFWPMFGTNIAQKLNQKSFQISIKKTMLE